MKIPPIILNSLSQELLSTWASDMQARRTKLRSELANLSPTSETLAFAYQSIQTELTSVTETLQQIKQTLAELFPATEEGNN